MMTGIFFVQGTTFSRLLDSVRLGWGMIRPRTAASDTVDARGGTIGFGVGLGVGWWGGGGVAKVGTSSDLSNKF